MIRVSVWGVFMAVCSLLSSRRLAPTICEILAFARLLGSVAEWPLCTCHDAAARRGGRKENNDEDQSDHCRGAGVGRPRGRRRGSGGAGPGRPVVLALLPRALGVHDSASAWNGLERMPL